MSFFEKLYNYLCAADETKTAAEEEMKNKTDKQLIEIAKAGGTSAQAIGRRNAALQELKERGYNV